MNNAAHEFSCLGQLRYFDVAALGIAPDSVRTSTQAMLNDKMSRGTAGNPEFRSERVTAAAESAIRGLLGVTSGKSFIASSAMGTVDAVLRSLPAGAGTVVCADDEYPGLVEIGRRLCWNGERKLRLVSAGEDCTGLVDAIDDRAKVVLVSQVHWISGRASALHVIGEARRRHDFLLVVDASQGLPIVPIDPEEIGADVLVAAGYKWLAGALGSAVVHLSDRVLEILVERLGADLWPVVPSTQSYVAMHQLAGSVSWMRAYGPDAIRKRTVVAAQAIRDFAAAAGLAALSPDAVQRSGIVSLPCPAERAGRIVERARAEGLHVSARGAALRLSPHFTVSVDECRDAVELLQNISSTINT